MADKVFVYGTLMKGHGNHSYYLSQSEFHGKGEITGYALYAVSSFPGIVLELFWSFWDYFFYLGRK